MGFWKRLIGGEKASAASEAPAPAAQPVVGEPVNPYRSGGASLPPPPPPPRSRRKSSFEPIWDSSWTDIFALERGGEGELPVRAICYCGDASGDYRVVRRVSFTDGVAAVDWEEPLAEHDFLSDHYTCRIEDRVLVPRAQGLIAVHVDTGELCWELPHPARLHYEPRLTPEGELLLVFKDQTWMRVAPRDGAFCAEGRVRTESEARDLRDRAAEMVRTSRHGSTRVGGALIEIVSGGLRVAKAKKASEDGRPPPAAGEYPIDEWTPESYLGLVNATLVVLLSRRWGDRNQLALGLLEPTSLEPLRLVELGDGSVNDVEEIDGLLALRGSFASPGEARVGGSLIVDVHAQRVVASFAEDHISFQFDPGGAQAWKGKI